MESEYDERQIITQEIIQKEAKCSYCGQVSCTIGALGSAYNYDRNGFLAHITHTSGEGQNVVPTSLRESLLYHPKYIRWQDINVKNVYTAVCKGGVSDRTWRTTSMQM